MTQTEPASVSPSTTEPECEPLTDDEMRAVQGFLQIWVLLRSENLTERLYGLVALQRFLTQELTLLAWNMTSASQSSPISSSSSSPNEE